MKVLLIFLFFFNIERTSSSSFSCPADTYPDVYRGGLRDLKHCTTFVPSRELKTVQGTPETKGGKSLLLKMVNFCKYNFKNGQLLSYLNEEAMLYHGNYEYPEKEITVHSATEVGKSTFSDGVRRFHKYWNNYASHECYFNTAIYFNRTLDEIASTHMERCLSNVWGFFEIRYIPNHIRHPWWQDYTFPESGKEYEMGLEIMCRCMKIESRNTEYKFATRASTCSAHNCQYFACVSSTYKDCQETRFKRCTFPPNETICREYTYVRQQEADIPYGKECPERDYGEICECPCSDKPWSEWSAKSTTCGPYTRERYKVVREFENVDVDCTKERHKCCFSIEQGLQTNCTDFFINSNKTIMEYRETCKNNNGQIIKTEAGYFCECDDSRHGTLCENDTGLCKKDTCKNGGCCAALSETHFQCLCADGFKGTLCEGVVSRFEEIVTTLSNSYITIAIAICSLLAVAFLCISGQVVRRRRKRRRGRHSRKRREPKKPKTLSTETNL
ncbi:Protocadherin Fat [Trichinella pseudospiralis]